MQSKRFTASGALSNFRGQVMGWNVSAGGSAVTVNLRETDGSGIIIIQIQVPVNTSKEQFLTEGIEFSDKIYVELVSGTPNNLTVFWE